MNIKVENSVKHSSDVITLVEKKLIFFQDVIQKTILNVQKNKLLDILGVSEVTTCINASNNISEKLKELNNGIDSFNTDILINKLQVLNNEMSSLIKNYGTDSLEDLLTICFGNNSIQVVNNNILKYELLKKYFHPTHYKVLNTKRERDNEIKIKNDDFISDNIQNLHCIDISLNSKHFHMKVYGLKMYISNTANKSLLIFGIVDDVILSFLNNKYIVEVNQNIKLNIPSNCEFKHDSFDKFLESLTLKDYLIHNHNDIYNKFIGYMTNHNLLKQKTLLNIVKDFITSDLYTKRNLLIQILISSDEYDNKYLAYLLYDLLSNDVNGNIDTIEQTILFDSFPLSIKQYFREAMKRTIQYTNDLSNFDINKIPLEQQICLMKTSDVVKEKAMMKLKEIKAKSEDSGSKARQYLDGLLKIPFNIYKKEPVMELMNENKKKLLELLTLNKFEKLNKKKEKYTSIEVISTISKLKKELVKDDNDTFLKKIKKQLSTSDKNSLLSYILKINSLIEIKNIASQKINYSGKQKKELICQINNFICNIHDKKDVLLDLSKVFNIEVKFSKEIESIEIIESNLNKITSYISNVKSLLDKAVYGHDNAKKHIERIVGQWINGEQDGYCFGFEGPPGVGKTSLAKYGLSSCLLDDKGNTRPFAMIQMGGDANGSTLHGHNYTYVGSTWGGIVQILIDKKCMNPIILIDELDKISKTEHGKEIVGILTHLLDPTQNDCFQDKYFSGIYLDLSKALFILSYNDVDAIDKILLDRIHRIKFSNLSLEDKLIILNRHILPEVFKKMGLDGVVNFDDEVLKFIIDEYTCEPGVRKLKEVLFEIVGEINLDILKNNCIEYPIDITIESIKTKYFKDKNEIRIKKIHNSSFIGIINGLWANSMGRGGIIPIQAKFYPCDKFLNLKLTGMQGDIMKESMNVALTLAWSLTCIENKDMIMELYEDKKNGIHIHCPEGSVPKDGPSAGSAITTVIYSILNNKKIKNYIGITGEISLDGFISEIGGLDLKILGGIKAGIKEFIYPVENKRDYENFIEKYKDTEVIKNIIFHSVSHINEVFDIIFEN